jgi:hypothetical protein
MKPLKGSVGKVASGAGVKPKSPVKPITGGMAGVRSVPAKPIMTPTRPAMPGRAASAPMAGRGLGSGPTMSKPAGLTAQQVKNIRSVPKSVTKPMTTPKPSMLSRAAGTTAPKAIAKAQQMKKK